MGEIVQFDHRVRRGEMIDEDLARQPQFVRRFVEADQRDRISEHVMPPAHCAGRFAKVENRDRIAEDIVPPPHLRLWGDRNRGLNQAQIMAVARPEHRLMFAENDGFTISVHGVVNDPQPLRLHPPTPIRRTLAVVEI